MRSNGFSTINSIDKNLFPNIMDVRISSFERNGYLFVTYIIVLSIIVIGKDPIMYLKNLSIFLPLILCFVFMLGAQEQAKLQIAVVDLSNTGGLSQQESVTLTNRLRSMLVRTNAFIVLERGKMEGILQEQGFQQSGCTSTECVVEMGKLLNVQKIISGSIGKVGKIYTIDISLIDIKTARIEKSFIFDHEGEIGGLLKLMETIANDIAATVTGEKKEEKKYGSIEIKTEPKKASVYLNDQLMGISPLSLKEVTAGSHNLQVKANGYEDSERKVMISDQELTRVNIELKKLYKLSVKSSPAGARVLINSQDAGETPFTTTVKEDMKFELKLVKENYQEWKKQIEVDDDIELDRKLEFTKKYKQELAAKAKEEKELAKKAKEEQELAAKAKREREKPAVQKEKGGGKTWLWIGGGAVLLAGGAAYYFLSQEDEEEEQDTGMPMPVGRPQ
jgi:TolB-like protein